MLDCTGDKVIFFFSSISSKAPSPSVFSFLCVLNHSQIPHMWRRVSHGHFPTRGVREPNSSEQQQSGFSAGPCSPGSNSARFKLLKINGWCSRGPTGTERDSREGSQKRVLHVQHSHEWEWCGPWGDLEKAFQLRLGSCEIMAISRRCLLSCDGTSL